MRIRYLLFLLIVIVLFSGCTTPKIKLYPSQADPLREFTLPTVLSLENQKPASASAGAGFFHFRLTSSSLIPTITFCFCVTGLPPNVVWAVTMWIPARLCRQGKARVSREVASILDRLPARQAPEKHISWKRFVVSPSVTERTCCTLPRSNSRLTFWKP